MKKNPLLVVAGVLLVYGFIISIANLAGQGSYPILGNFMIFRTDSLGINFMYFLILGFLSGFIAAKGIQNIKKRSKHQDF